MMNMVRFNPFKEFDSFFNTYGRNLPASDGQEGMIASDWTPSVDITEDKENFVIKAELPEVPKENVKVTVDNGILTFSGERKSEFTDEKKHRVERFYGSFSRSFSLPDNIDEENIRADSKDGMLYLTLPKTTPKEHRKQIEIN